MAMKYKTRMLCIVLCNITGLYTYTYKYELFDCVIVWTYTCFFIINVHLHQLRIWFKLFQLFHIPCKCLDRIILQCVLHICNHALFLTYCCCWHMCLLHFWMRNYVMNYLQIKQDLFLKKTFAFVVICSVFIKQLYKITMESCIF